MALIIADRVKETSTSTGTGALTLSGPATAFRSFSSVCAVGDTAYYALQAVNGSGVPTGDWECGLGTYSAANTLTRTTVTSSSNAGSAVVLSAGAKEVYISMPAVQVAWVREKLYAPRTYYVNPTTGSDTNDGLSIGKPFSTLQAAINSLSALDMGVHEVVIQLSDGTHSGGAYALPYMGSSAPIIQGNETTPGNVVLDGFDNSVPGGRRWTVQNLKLADGYNSLNCSGGDNSLFCYNLEFGTGITEPHINAKNGGLIFVAGYKIYGGVGRHISSDSGGRVRIAGGVDITASVSISTFAFATNGGSIDASSASFTLGGSTVTGKRYTVDTNGVIYTNGVGGATFFPGTTAGTSATGGQYV